MSSNEMPSTRTSHLPIKYNMFIFIAHGTHVLHTHAYIHINSPMFCIVAAWSMSCLISRKNQYNHQTSRINQFQSRAVPSRTEWIETRNTRNEDHYSHQARFIFSLAHMHTDIQTFIFCATIETVLGGAVKLIACEATNANTFYFVQKLNQMNST